MRITYAAPGGTLAHSRPVLSNQSAFHHLLGINNNNNNNNKSRQLACQLMSPVFLELRKRREGRKEWRSNEVRLADCSYFQQASLL